MHFLRAYNAPVGVYLFLSYYDVIRLSGLILFTFCNYLGRHGLLGVNMFKPLNNYCDKAQ